jgi:hypothetical protein
MTGCCSHDLLDWVTALAPTAAATGAVVATIYVYRRSEQLQRQLVRPLLVVKHQINPGVIVRWIVTIQNEGQGAANIEAITVLAGEKIQESQPMQSPVEYWKEALHALGILAFQSLEDTQVILPPYSIPIGGRVVLFDAQIPADTQDIGEAIKIRLRYKSVLGETYKLHHRYGHSDS